MTNSQTGVMLRMNSDSTDNREKVAETKKLSEKRYKRSSDIHASRRDYHFDDHSENDEGSRETVTIIKSGDPNERLAGVMPSRFRPPYREMECPTNTWIVNQLPTVNFRSHE